MGRVGYDVSWIEEILSTNSNCTKSKNHDDICNKNYHNISDEVGVQEILSINLKAFINNYDIGRVGYKVT